ncbi:WXG100 family type VII secretion target [Streptomyces sp. NPDC060194]|uniref:WXG100 family type VII secretion target n=1 Tax=Streptomyces sp. NPDC060194 TaxID=3347069 RepID=UPI00365A7B9F
MPYNPDEILATYSTIDQAAADIERQGKALDTELQNIQQAVARVAEVWQGEAKSAYDDAQRKWDKEAADIRTALSRIVAALRNASPAYQAGDRRGAASFL